MFYSSKQLAKTLLDLSNERPNQAKQIADNFLEFCKKKNLTNRLPKILKRLDEFNARQKRDTNLIITTKEKISDKLIGGIKQFINATKTETITETDKSIQGGFIARYQGKIYDGSVRNQITKIKIKMNLL